jgi:glycosyltransferase involved in cell wall biosynthesis
MAAPLLIALPDGLSVSGVSIWAARLANGLVQSTHSARAVALILHREPPGSVRLDLPLDPRIMVLPDGPPLPRFEEAPGDLSAIIPKYRAAAALLAARAGTPVILSPNLHGDCYGAAAALAAKDPEIVRVVAWNHSDIEYNARVLTHYEPLITKYIAVSDAIEGVLRERLPARTADILNIPYGVDTDSPPPTARTLREAAPIRLIYTGRIEHEQKRIGALVHLADELNRRGIAHQITVVGDGPAAANFDIFASTRPSVLRLAPVGPARIGELLDQHDAFVLPSRYEGLSIAMLEAMARGCIPVLARTRSGALQVIEPGYNGELADVDPAADEAATAAALAASIQRHLARSPQQRLAMSDAARATVRARFSLAEHLRSVEALLDAAAAASPRGWPADRPCAFTAAPGAAGRNGWAGSGSVPPEGPARLAKLLDSLAGRAIVVHGVGQHTLQLAEVFARSPATIVAFSDDDPKRCGERLWGSPIVRPAEAAATGATEVIISSWMHQQSIWARRGIYEQQGLRVHTIY